MKRGQSQSAGKVPLNRALSKLGLLSRSQATTAIRAGRVSVDGRVVADPAALIVPERARIAIDHIDRDRAPWRMIAFHKPRGVVTTRCDPGGRRTVFDVLGDAGAGLIAVGRLDLATSGLLLLTNDTRLADWITDPVNAVTRVYIVQARGAVTPEEATRMMAGIRAGRDRLRAHEVSLIKTSRRESHVRIELREGRTREVRRLFEAVGHEVTRLKRIRFGAIELGDLAPGKWREMSRQQISAAFPSSPIRLQ